MDETKTEIPSATPAEDKTKVESKEPLHDPVKDELAKQQDRKTRSEREKAVFSLKKNAERVKALGEDPAVILGIEQEEEGEVPEWYQKEKAKEGQKTALQLADQLTDEDEKALVKSYLESRVVPSGNPHDDFRFALNAVHAVKNKQIAEEVARRTTPPRAAVGGSQPAKVDDEFVPTEHEAHFMRPPYSLSKEQIVAARKKQTS